eukprot:352038-Chlamydomonas_euryale.AAC.1
MLPWDGVMLGVMLLLNGVTLGVMLLLNGCDGSGGVMLPSGTVCGKERSCCKVDGHVPPPTAKGEGRLRSLGRTPSLPARLDKAEGNVDAPSSCGAAPRIFCSYRRPHGACALPQPTLFRAAEGPAASWRGCPGG